MKKEHRELRRRPLLTPLWLSALIGFAALAAVAGFVSCMTTTTVVVVRDAEKELGSIEDPPLSLAGEQRVQALARIFGARASPGRLTAVFADDTRRTQSTAAPLAARLDLAITVEAEVDRLLERIHREHRGENVLVVARAETLPEIVRRLGRLPAPPALAETDHATLFIVTTPTLGHPSVLRMSY